MTSLILGVDGGGTKTVAALATLDGELVGRGSSGGSNPQSMGIESAARAVEEAIEGALKAANARREDIAASAFGMSGADFDRGRRLVEATVGSLGSFGRTFVENDTLLVLRLASKELVGVGLVSGTGINCIGLDRSGRRIQIGGMGAVSGDLGSASDLAELAIAEAWRQVDGRTVATDLGGAVLDAFGTRDLEAIAEAWGSASPRVPSVVSALFACARARDPAALSVLGVAARRLGEAAATCAVRLGLAEPVVALGGSMFSLPGHEPFRAAVMRDVLKRIPAAHVRAPVEAPVTGALLLAADQLGRSELEDVLRAAARRSREPDRTSTE
ncbi:MAG: hypothetical protein HYV07_20460 [Deltaproteobacteria bacterium]|nr:hypothetical protein [Deltaproteobacteria bacterium]